MTLYVPQNTLFGAGSGPAVREEQDFVVLSIADIQKRT